MCHSLRGKWRLLAAVLLVLACAFAAHYHGAARQRLRPPSAPRRGSAGAPGAGAATTPARDETVLGHARQTAGASATKAAQTQISPLDSTPFALRDGDVIRIRYDNYLGDGKVIEEDAEVDGDGYVVSLSFRFSARGMNISELQSEIRRTVAAVFHDSPAAPVTITLVRRAPGPVVPAVGRAASRPIQIGDTLDLIITNLYGNGEETVTWRRVGPRGTIEIPSCGSVMVAEMTPEAVGLAIAKEADRRREPISVLARIRSP